MKFLESFLNDIKKYNGQIVHLTIIQIDETNHPLGLLGAMMMGAEQKELIRKAAKEYNSKNGIVEIDAYMELIINSIGEKLIFINNNFGCNCIEIFRPDPPRIIEGKDMSLRWSYHPLSIHELNQLTLLKSIAQIKQTTAIGDCFQIRDIIINGNSHCMFNS